MNRTDADPKGLIRESYAIIGITAGECRSIFLDWALSLPVAAEMPIATQLMIDTYGATSPEHPMTVVLHEGLLAPEHPRRRGGRAARVSQD